MIASPCRRLRLGATRESQGLAGLERRRRPRPAQPDHDRTSSARGCGRRRRVTRFCTAVATLDAATAASQRRPSAASRADAAEAPESGRGQPRDRGARYSCRLAALGCPRRSSSMLVEARGAKLVDSSSETPRRGVSESARAAKPRRRPASSVQARRRSGREGEARGASAAPRAPPSILGARGRRSERGRRGAVQTRGAGGPGRPGDAGGAAGPSGPGAPRAGVGKPALHSIVRRRRALF
jgi:hypothetical protein